MKWRSAARQRRATRGGERKSEGGARWEGAAMEESSAAVSGAVEMPSRR